MGNTRMDSECECVFANALQSKIDRIEHGAEYRIIDLREQAEVMNDLHNER